MTSEIVSDKEELSLADVADIIMLEFCKELGGLEYGSPYIEKAYRAAGLNLYSPTYQQVKDAIDNLAEIEIELFDKETSEKNLKNRLEMLDSVEVTE